MKFHKLTNLTVFAVLLKDVPMGCKDSVLPEQLLNNQNVNCLDYEENTKIFANSEHLLSTCMEKSDPKKKHPKFITFSRTNVEKEIHQSSRMFT